MSLHRSDFTQHYLLLMLLFIVGLGGIVVFRSNLQLSLIILWTTIFGYIAWGTFHHVMRKDLSLSVVMEYLLVGAIAGLVIQAVLLAL